MEVDTSDSDFSTNEEIEESLNKFEKVLIEDQERQRSKVASAHELQLVTEDHTFELRDIRTLKEIILQENNEESRKLKMEVFTRCCENPLGLWYPTLGFTDFVLQWFKILEKKDVQHLNAFLQRERTETNIGRILPSKFNFLVKKTFSWFQITFNFISINFLTLNISKKNYFCFFL